MKSLTPALLRTACVGIALVLWFWTQKAIAKKSGCENKISDRLHDWTAGLHARLLANPAVANATLVVTSALIDAFGLFLVGVSIFGPSVRPFLALLMVFALRQACQGVCTLPFPEGTIWRYPGFPSLLVTYGTSNDFFFSGHTAIAVIGALEVAAVSPGWLVLPVALIAAGEAFTVILLRAHYTMDVVAAVFAAWCCDFAAGRLAPTVDLWFRQLS